MNILIALMIKHFFADYLLNRSSMGIDKYRYIYGGKLHSFTHFITCLITLAFFVEPAVALAWAVFDGLAHYHIDWTKTNIIRKYNLNNMKDWRLRTIIGADQSLHFLTYVLIAVVI